MMKKINGDIGIFSISILYIKIQIKMERSPIIVCFTLN
jgi:hypothetical protein